MTTIETVIQQVAQLPIAEQLQLLARLTERLRQHDTDADPTTYSWMSLRGLVSYPYVGEDAQVWVARSRQEGDRLLEQGG
ncbi:MAG: hypothetical protein HC911_01690 [Chloroflexaceae bacterium]|nr:hypothetical protein [Chloroflexaceae bacterium]